MNFLEWYRRNQSEITWWIIGWLSFAILEDVLRENWGGTAINSVLIYINYKIWKNR